jgi:hypothetical protein
VLLDLKRDKYLGVGRGQMKALASCVAGWPAVAQEAPAAPADSFVAKLLAAGVLTTEPAKGKEAQPVTMPRPQTTLTALDLAASRDIFDTRPVIQAGHLIRFICATLSARVALKWRPIASVVMKVNASKVRRAVPRAMDFDAARKHAAAFIYLRPVLFTTKDKCLADSLALVNFLAHYGVFPTWVFGVQTGPFAAHCWVQAGDVVFNDTPDHVRRYTPILAV